MFQSDFRRAHSTETARRRVCSDIFMQNDAGKGFILLVLDLTLVFDTVNRHMLLDRLKYWVGVSGSASDGLSDAHLQWFVSTGHPRLLSPIVCHRVLYWAPYGF